MAKIKKGILIGVSCVIGAGVAAGASIGIYYSVHKKGTIKEAIVNSLDENRRLDFVKYSKINFTINYVGSDNHVKDLRFNFFLNDYLVNDYLKVIIIGKNSNVINAYIEVVKEPPLPSSESLINMEVYDVNNPDTILDHKSFTLSEYIASVPIPESCYDIEVGEDNLQHLKGFSGVDIPSDCNAMIIPSYVDVIDECAFVSFNSWYINSTIPSNIEKIVVSGSCKIEKGAFMSNPFKHIILDGYVYLSPSSFSRGYGIDLLSSNSYMPDNTKVYIGPNVTNIYSTGVIDIRLLMSGSPQPSHNDWVYPSFSGIKFDIDSVNVSPQNKHYELVNTFDYLNKIIGSTLLPKNNHTQKTDGMVLPVGDIITGCVDVNDWGKENQIYNVPLISHISCKALNLGVNVASGVSNVDGYTSSGDSYITNLSFSPNGARGFFANFSGLSLVSTVDKNDFIHACTSRGLLDNAYLQTTNNNMNSISLASSLVDNAAVDNLLEQLEYYIESTSGATSIFPCLNLPFAKYGSGGYFYYRSSNGATNTSDYMQNAYDLDENLFTL